MSIRKTIGEYKARAILKHGPSDFDYSLWPESIINNKHRVKTVCPKHGVFEQTVTKHVTDGRGCRQCGSESVSRKITKTGEYYVQKAINVFGDKYDYSLVPRGPIGSLDTVKVFCDKHGVFERSISFLHCYDCPRCGNESKRTGRKRSIEESKRIHGGLYDYNAWPEDITSETYVVTKCPEHGPWRHKVRKHLEGSGCHKCARGGFKHHEIGYLYFLRNEDGLVKVGVSNNYKARIERLRKMTPFSFDVLAVFLHKKGSQVLETEKLIHKYNKSAGFSGFDGATEWRHIKDFDVLNLPELFGFTRIL